MAQITLPVSSEQAKDLSLRRKFVTITHVEQSELPYRIEKKNTGVHMASFDCAEKVVEFLLQCCPEVLARKPTRRRGPR